MKITNRTIFQKVYAYLYIPIIGMITYAILFVFDYLVGLQINHIYLFFVIPIGGFVIGLVFGIGYPLMMINFGFKKHWIHYVIQTFVTIILIMGMFFMYYLTSYVEDGHLNNRFKGSHITEYLQKETGETYGIFKSTLITIDQMHFGPTKYYIRKYSGTIQSSGFNRFITILQLLSIFLGSLGMYQIIIRDQLYCNTCKKYLKRIHILKVDANDQQTLNAFYNQIHQTHTEGLKALMKTYNPKSKNKSNKILMATYYVCEHHGKLVIRAYQVRKGQKTYIKDSIVRYNIQPEDCIHINQVLKELGIGDVTQIF